MDLLKRSGLNEKNCDYYVFNFFCIEFFWMQKRANPREKNSCTENPQAEGCPRSNGNIVSTPAQKWEMDSSKPTEKSREINSGNIISTKPKTWDMNEK